MSTVADIPDLLADMAAHGITPAHPESIRLDDTHQRYRVLYERAGTRNGWLIGHLDADGAGGIATYGDWHTGGKTVWHRTGIHRSSSAVRVTMDQSAAAAADARRAGERKYAVIAKHEHAEYTRLPAAPADHPYLVAHGGIYIPGGRLDLRGNLVLPMYRVADVMWVGTQRIWRRRVDDKWPKRIHGRKLGACIPFALAGQRPHRLSAVLIAEGAATARAAQIIRGLPALAAMDAGNLLRVARAMRHRHPETRLVIAADNDLHRAEGNPGVTAAREARDAIPDVEVWAPDIDGDWCDVLAARKQKTPARAVTLTGAERSI